MFSLRPTHKDFYIARVFQEFLIPIGSGPFTSENSAQVYVLQDYLKHSRPDDFTKLTGLMQSFSDSS